MIRFFRFFVLMMWGIIEFLCFNNYFIFLVVLEIIFGLVWLVKIRIFLGLFWSNLWVVWSFLFRLVCLWFGFMVFRVVISIFWFLVNEVVSVLVLFLMCIRFIWVLLGRFLINVRVFLWVLLNRVGFFGNVCRDIDIELLMISIICLVFLNLGIFFG